MTQLLDTFNIEQGIRQGGILRADVYKVYVDILLHRLQDETVWYKLSYNCMCRWCSYKMYPPRWSSVAQRYKLQPDESVAIEPKSKDSNIYMYTMRDKILQNVETLTYHGIHMYNSLKYTISTYVHSNINKTRRTTHTLRSAGLHRGHGLNPHTSLQ